MTSSLGFLQPVWRRLPSWRWPPPWSFVSTVPLSGGLFQYFSNGCVVSQSIVFHTGQSTCVFPNCQVLKSYSWPDVELRWFFFLLSFTWQFQQSGKYTYTRIGYFCCRNLNINGKSLAWPFMSLIVWTLALLFLCGICHHRRQDDCLLFILTI